MSVRSSSLSGYVLWAVGVVTVVVTVVQAARRGGGPAFRLPSLAPHRSTILAWLIVLVVALVALAQHR